jgi:solute carrier family 40 (iron-regulated transporter), member 1
MTDVNAKMRRIDLACKLLSPFLIASIDAASTRWAIWTTLLMTCLSVPAEYLFIKQIYALIPRLRRQSGQANPAVSTLEESETEHSVTSPARPRSSVFLVLLSTLRHILPLSSVARYIRSPAFLPSLAYAFLHLTVLSFSGRMIAFLLAVGYDPLQVGIARVVSTAAELSATWISPWATNRLGSVRLAGVWSISWQTGWLTLGVVAFLVAGGMLGVTGLVVGVIMSRIGLWGFDLAVHNIIQDVCFFYTCLLPFPPYKGELSDANH